MTRAGVVAGLVVVWAAVTVWALQDAEERGARRAQLAQLEARVETLTVIAARVDTIFRDSVRVATKWRTRWDTVKATDTLTVDSVVYVPLAPAESTITACFAALRSCDRAVAARDTLISALRLQLDAQPKPTSAVRVWAERALWLSAGVGVGQLVRR